MSPNILFVCGSLNQTTMMHKISRHLPEFDCAFTPFYADGWMKWVAQSGLAKFSILGGRHRANTEAYLKNENLAVDFGGQRGQYDAVVTGTDLLIQGNIRQRRLVLVQEGITEAEDFSYFLVRYLKLPRFVANTAATGLSDLYDLFCVASPGYRDLFIRKGARAEKIVVTGIPNFDHAFQYLNNDFPYHGYVLVATSSIRETLKFDDRERFLQQVCRLAGGRQILFKLHPNENAARATREIRKYFPDEPIYTEGNVHHMIANCAILIAQNSSVIYTGLALGKEVHSSLDRATLQKLAPVQNGGKSAERIAEVCRQLIQTPLAEINRARLKGKFHQTWEGAL